MSQNPPKNVVEVASHGLLSVGGKPDHGMDYGTFMATEGGRKCPMCGKYAKKGTVGNISFTADIGGGWAHISMYGHLPGYGCNAPDNAEVSRGDGNATSTTQRS
jgi:hypothetical protein